MNYSHERNYGCRLWDDLAYHGLKTLVMENEKLRITVLVDKGTDIFEFLYKPLDIDFMWRSPLGVRNVALNIPSSANVSESLSEGGLFLDYYEGGWQEIFPHGGPPCIYKGAEFGLHGEVWGIPWKYQIIEDTSKKVSVKFWVRTYRTPFYIEKTLTLNSKESVLRIKEKITNEGKEEMDFMWGHHPAFGPAFLDNSCVVDIPAERVKTPKRLSPTSRLKQDTESDWPYALGKDGGKVDLSKVLSADAETTDMSFIKDLKEGRYTITNIKKKIGFEMRWDIKVFPCIWYWQEFGGHRGYPWYGRTYNIALEPFSTVSEGLSEAVNGNTQLRLKAGKSLETEIMTIIHYQ